MYFYFNSEWIDLRSAWNMCTIVDFQKILWKSTQMIVTILHVTIVCVGRLPTLATNSTVWEHFDANSRKGIDFVLINSENNNQKKWRMLDPFFLYFQRFLASSLIMTSVWKYSILPIPVKKNDRCVDPL